MNPPCREALIAAANNVDWYRAVLRAHGREASLVDNVWFFPGRPPPYHSNAVTLSPSEPEAQCRVIDHLRGMLDPPFAVKDSFAALDLADRGFRPLFDAQWIWRDPGPPPSPINGWCRAVSPPDLDAWERGLRENGSPASERAFPPRLLDDETVAFLGLWEGDRLLAGYAANRSADAVGLSNLFSTGSCDDSLFSAALGAVQGFAPGLPVVGFESGDALARAERHGFRAVGPLRVWIRDLS
ncbi:MAG TPA: hypothetical protein VFK86_04680 [Bauldia sp.]|nr:hypothetical protein [Bauldia sp.]